MRVTKHPMAGFTRGTNGRAKQKKRKSKTRKKEKGRKSNKFSYWQLFFHFKLW